MKTAQLSVKKHPQRVHAQKRVAKSVTGREWARRLREAEKLLTREERHEMADAIDEARILMSRENLR